MGMRFSLGSAGNAIIADDFCFMQGSFCFFEVKKCSIVLWSASEGSGLDERYILLLKTGICGGFTTFSTFALESVTLFQSGRPAAAVAYCALSLVLSIAAVFLAQSLAG